jgi:hypothetical protein
MIEPHLNEPTVHFHMRRGDRHASTFLFLS